MPKYPHVKVKLIGKDGNAFSILANVRKEMRRAHIAEEEISAFFKEATSGDYHNLILTCMRWVEVS